MVNSSTHWAHSSARLERIPDKDEVPGSNPGGPTKARLDAGLDDFSHAERARLGITDSLCRYACGIENADDIINDIEQALAKV